MYTLFLYKSKDDRARACVPKTERAFGRDRGLESTEEPSDRLTKRHAAGHSALHDGRPLSRHHGCGPMAHFRRLHLGTFSPLHVVWASD